MSPILPRTATCGEAVLRFSHVPTGATEAEIVAANSGAARHRAVLGAHGTVEAEITGRAFTDRTAV